MRSWAQHVAPALILPPVLPPLERLVAVPRVDDLAPLLLQWRRLGAREARNLVRDPINDGGWQLLRVKNRVISRETRHTLQMRAPVMGLQRSLAQKRSRRHQDSVAAKAGRRCPLLLPCRPLRRARGHAEILLVEDALELPKELGGAQGGRAARAAARRGEAQLRAHVEVPAAHEVSLLCNELWHAPLRDRAHVPGRGVKGGWGG